MADEYYDEKYGGLLFAVSASEFRIWAPSVFRLFKTGYVINIEKGWGQSGSSDVSYESGQYRVMLRKSKPADYDSGWFDMESNHPDKSFVEVRHGLGTCTVPGGPCCNTATKCRGVNMITAKVEVSYRAKSGANQGFVFKATI